MRSACLRHVTASFAPLVFAVLTPSASGGETMELRGRAEQGVDGAQVCARTPSSCFTLTGVTVNGASALPAAEFASIYEPYLTRDVSFDDLARIAFAITERYRERGFFLSRAIVPPQQPEDGMARIDVIEGRISSLSIEGPGAATVRRFMAGFDTLGPANLNDLDRRLRLAADTPGIEIHSVIEPDPDDLRLHRLRITAALHRTNAFASIDNRGPRENGRWQTYARVTGNSVLAPGDQVAIAAYTTPNSSHPASSLEAFYSYQYATGATLSARASASRAGDGANAGSAQIGGNAATAQVRFEYPLLRTHAAGLWASAAFDVRSLAWDWWSGGGYADETRVASLRLRGFLTDDLGQWAWAGQVSAGIDFLGASSGSSTRRSRRDANGQFSKLNLHASFYRDIGRYFGVYASADGQWSEDSLLLSEEFSLGGLPYGRAFDYGELTGDRGLAGAIELRAGFNPQLGPISFVQAYVFIDGGEVWNFETAGMSTAALSSAGVGSRVTFADRFVASLEMAQPVRGADRDNWREAFTLSARY